MLIMGTKYCFAQSVAESLKIDFRNEAVGIQDEHPVFSWEINSKKRNVLQHAYKIIVASSIELLHKNRGDIWNSGKRLSAGQNGIHYEGSPLLSETKYYYKVKIWDNQGDSAWSRPSFWITGILHPMEWKAKWITFDTSKARSLPLFRKLFIPKKQIKQAIINISGLGYYELYINGRKVGDHVLDPAQTNYNNYAFYACYDVTKMLHSTKDCIGVMLGDGWYNQDRVWGGLSYGNPLLICQLHIEYMDGTYENILSDRSWIWTNGPVNSSNIYAGETYDARKEIPNWSDTGNVNHAKWMPVKLAKTHPDRLISQPLPPIKEIEELKVKRIFKIDSDRYVFDFGQNFAGWVRLKLNHPKRGRVIKIRFSEETDSNHIPNFASTGVYATGVIQTDEYTCKGNAREVWEPRFTYHGFRYAEVSGLSSMPDKNLLTGIVVHSSVEPSGKFSCSNQQINRLHQMSRWTLSSNLYGIPTDCPQRERCGWLGDAHTVAQTSIYNYDMQSFWIKYLHDIRSTASVSRYATFQVYKNRRFRKGFKEAGIPFMIAPGKRLCGVASVDWGTAIVQLPWYLYLYYGNNEVLRKFYPEMRRWVEFEHTLSKNGIIYEGLGDWCPPPGGDQSMDCPVALSSTAFYFLDVSLIKHVAELLGRQEDVLKFKAWRDSIKEAFNNQFFNLTSKSYGSQTGDVMAVRFGLVPGNEAVAVSDDIAKLSRQKCNGFMQAGIFGLKGLFNVLSNYGNDSAAFHILTKKGENSFAYMWDKYNATTFWETLPTNDSAIRIMGCSHNHAMQTGFDQYFFAGVLGIKPVIFAPGFKKIKMDLSLINQLKWAKGSYHSIYGVIKSEWHNNKDTFTWSVSIPPNTDARLYFPSISKKITERGVPVDKVEGVKNFEIEGGKIVLDVGSGNYNFILKK